MSLNLCAISDLHGFLIPVEEFKKHDVTVICGDISPLNIQMNNRKLKKWLIEVFKPWCEELPSDKVYFISGNHDIVPFRDPDFMWTNFSISGKVVYLNGSGDIYHAKDGNGYEIYGTPWCQSFGNWAFMTNEEELEKIYSVIPNNLDILLCHDAPYGVSDVLLQKDFIYYTGEHIGNKPLAEAIIRKAPKIVFHGHLHSSSREFESLWYSKVVNCSIKDEYYNPIYDPIYINIEK